MVHALPSQSAAGHHILPRTQCDACELALDVFQQMHADNVQPNVVTYNTLVDVYGKTGAWDKAVRVLDDMREQARLHHSSSSSSNNTQLLLPVCTGHA